MKQIGKEKIRVAYFFFAARMPREILNENSFFRGFLNIFRWDYE